MRRVILAAALVAFMALPEDGFAYGPGMHVREARTLLEWLAAEDPDWAEVMEDTPNAWEYLYLGSIAPDMEFWVEGIDFGHSVGLSYHLVDTVAGQDPRLLLFALGHLSHVGGGDPSSEQWLAPLIVGYSKLGMLDVVAGQDGPPGESEGLTEVFGDFVIGDWQGVVDTLYAFWLESQEAQDRLEEVFLWYCGEAGTYFGRTLDCTGALAQAEGILSQADGLLGGFSKEQAKALVASLLSGPPEDIAQLLYGAASGSFLPARVEPSEHHDSEYRRLLASELMDPQYWLLYESMNEIGPAVSKWFLEDRPTPGTWPTFTDKPLIWGNIRSIMNWLPEFYAAAPPFLVDEVSYHSAGGTRVTVVPGGGSPAQYEARVWLYAGLPFSGTVRGVVKRDVPGLDPSLDEVLGEAVLAFSVDPVEYGPRPREEIRIPFTTTYVAGTLGYYVELFVDESPLPWFTTNWDRLWTAGLPMHRPVYTDNFGSYGHWPPSLPVDGAVPPTVLLVSVRVAPEGPGVPGAAVKLALDTRTTGQGGVAVFENPAVGGYHVTASAQGFAVAQPVPLDILAHMHNWAVVKLHAVPRFDVENVVGGWLDPGQGAVSVLWFDSFAGEATHVRFDLQFDDGTVWASDTAAVVPGPPDQPRHFDVTLEGNPPPDGTRITPVATAVYHDGSPGVSVERENFRLDATPPVLTSVVTGHAEEPWCPEVLAGWIPLTVVMEEAHAPFGDVLVLSPGDPESAPASILSMQRAGHTWTLSVLAPVSNLAFGQSLLVQVDSKTGVPGASMAVIIQRDPSCPEMVEPTPEPVAEQERDVLAESEDPTEVTADLPVDSIVSDVEADVPTKFQSGGCSVNSDSPSGAWSLVLLLYAVLSFRTRRKRSRYPA